MEKKNNSGKIDNAKVFGMFENLRKNLNSPARDSAEVEKITEKVDPFKLPSSNVIKEATEKTQVETASAQTVEIVETAPKTENTEKLSKTSTFDGIIYNGGSTQPKPKKKYNSYRNDTPLFFFDSFEEDDEEFTADDKKTEAEVVLTAPVAAEVEEAEEITEVEETEEITEAEEAEEITEVEETEEITEAEETEEITEVEETEEVTEVEEAEEITEVEEIEEITEVEEIEEITEAEETEEITEAEETEEITEAEEAEEVTEVEEAEEVTEVEEAEEITEVEEAEEITEVEETEEIPEAEEAEEITEVEETEEIPEAEEAEEVTESEEIDDAMTVKIDSDGLAIYGEYKTVELIDDGEYKVVRAIDSYGDYKIVIVKVDDDGHYDIYDVFDTDGGDGQVSGGEAVSEYTEATDIAIEAVDEDQLTVAEEIEESDIAVAEETYEEQTADAVVETVYGTASERVDITVVEAVEEIETAVDELSVAEELEIQGYSVDEDDYGDEAEPIVATEIEEAVSIAEEYSIGVKLQDKYKNLFSGDLFEEVDEPLTVATEIEDISLATEITSNIVLPGDAEEGADDDLLVDPESPDWVQDESFLRECAQLELPKLQTPMKDINSSDEEQISEFVNSGYEYTELPMLDAYIMEKARRKREEMQSKAQRTDSEPPKSDEVMRAEFYEKRANAFRNKSASKSRDAMKSVIYTAILAIIVLVFENIGKIASVPIVGAERAILMLIFDTALVFVGAFIIRSSLKESVSALMKLRYNCESVGVLALILTVIYGVFAVLTYSGDGEIPFIGVPMIACMLYSAALRYVAIKRDESLFNASCDEGAYCTLAQLERNSAVPEFKELRGMLGDNAGIYRPNYPKRTEKGYDLDGGSVDVGVFGVAVTVIALVLSVIAGAVRFSVGGSAAQGVATAVIALAFSLPVFLSVSVFAENSSLIKRSAQNGALILDRDTAADVKNGAVLLINDTDLFRSGDVKIVGFDINGADKDDRTVEAALGRIVNVIRSVGGTLSELFAQMGEGIDIDEPVELTDVSEKGISAYSGDSCIRIGSASYLGRFGVSVNVDTTERKDGEKMLYASENGVLCLRMVLSYEANKALCKRIDRLRGYGIAVSLKTCDPCIDTELLMRTTGIEPELLRAVKYALEDDRENDDGERDGGIVSTRGVEGLITALGNCARHGITLKRLKAVSAVLSLAVPVVLTVAAALSMPFTAIPLWTVGAYYGGSALLGWLLAKIL